MEKFEATSVPSFVYNVLLWRGGVGEGPGNKAK